MKKGINLYLVKEVDTKEKIDLFKQTNYDEVMLGVYDKVETLPLEEEVEYLDKVGLKYSVIHDSYNDKVLNNFWIDNEIGDEIEEDLKNQILKISKFNTKNFVIHHESCKGVEPTEIGLERLRRLLNVAEKFDINICVENLYNENTFAYIFDNIKHKNLKMCFDCGHENFLCPGANFLDKYYDYVTCVHLHDNLGILDDHKMLGFGTIDLDNLARGLSKCREIDNIILTSEIKYSKEEFNLELMQKNMNTLIELEKKINEYRK